MILVAGLGNIFLGDDGFGSAVLGLLREHAPPVGVIFADYGISSVHLAYDLLAGYRTTILVDATSRGGDPGTLYVIDLDTEPAGSIQVDAHGTAPDAVPGLVALLGGDPGRMLLVGCEPAAVTDGIGLSDPVRAAVPRAAELVLDLARQHTKTEV